ncbi:phospholipase D-like protein [Leeuwenhoekiella aestuarii]|uniref:Phospholipase D-like protein n=2 Tax=Leeuwenhoekiella aestuarii TaxID=2249426 RepID=A0A4V1KPV4_9FLAO|nr:phospholipase D-like protein [Leeuwenhoekiella aestuarii]RXG19308.1 phospholipase D-like protein [Leeuwenhoekiella aestuarii]
MDNFIIVYLILGFSLMIWAVIDLIRTGSLKGNHKILLLILLVALPVIGSIIYFHYKNTNRKRSTYFSR